MCWHIECSTFTASSFRTGNSSTGIPSPPLALFVVMLHKAHLSSHSRMSGFRWVITPLWLSGSWRSFLYSSSVYSCYLFLIPSASVNIYNLLWIHNILKYICLAHCLKKLPSDLHLILIVPKLISNVFNKACKTFELYKLHFKCILHSPRVAFYKSQSFTIEQVLVSFHNSFQSY